MWTGFRMHLGGAQAFFKIEADLVCYSKAIANGMPISILGGSKKIMRSFEKKDSIMKIREASLKKNLKKRKKIKIKLKKKDDSSFR